MAEIEPIIEEHVREGVMCIGCGYDLAGLPIADKAVCPECGFEIDESLTGPLLRHERAEWLGRVEKGLRATSFAIRGLGLTVLMFILMILGVTTLLMNKTIAPDGSSIAFFLEITFLYTAYVTLFALLLMLVLLARGAWLVSSPTRMFQSDGFNYRPWVRYGSLSYVALFVLAKFAGPGNTVMFNVSIAAGSVVALTALWVFQRGSMILNHEFDARCAKARALKRLKPMTYAGRVLRIALLVFIFYVIAQGQRDWLPLIVFLALLSWPMKRRDRKAVLVRVGRERRAAQDLNPATIPAP